MEDQNKAPETSCLYQEKYVHIYIFRKVICQCYEYKKISNSSLKCVYM